MPFRGRATPQCSHATPTRAAARPCSTTKSLQTRGENLSVCAPVSRRGRGTSRRAARRRRGASCEPRSCGRAPTLEGRRERGSGRLPSLRLARHGTWAPDPQLVHPVDVGLRRKEVRLLPCEHRRLIDSEHRRQLLGRAAELFAERFDLVPGHDRLTSPRAPVPRDGHFRHANGGGSGRRSRMSRSLPTASTDFQSSSTLSETVTSLTG